MTEDQRAFWAELGPSFKDVATTIPTAPFERKLWRRLGMTAHSLSEDLSTLGIRFLCLLLYPITVIVLTPLAARYRVLVGETTAQKRERGRDRAQKEAEELGV